MHQAIKDLFGRYENETNAALAGTPDMDAVGDLYDEAFIGSSPAGVMAGEKNDKFKEALVDGFAWNREIGARRMEIQNLRIELIDAMHALVRVGWRATYETDGTRRMIDFTNVYLTRTGNGQVRVFGWITGDESAELRKHGII